MDSSLSLFAFFCLSLPLVHCLGILQSWFTGHSVTHILWSLTCITTWLSKDTEAPPHDSARPQQGPEVPAELTLSHKPVSPGRLGSKQHFTHTQFPHYPFYLLFSLFIVSLHRFQVFGSLEGLLSTDVFFTFVPSPRHKKWQACIFTASSPLSNLPTRSAANIEDFTCVSFSCYNSSLMLTRYFWADSRGISYSPQQRQSKLCHSFLTVLFQICYIFSGLSSLSFFKKGIPILSWWTTFIKKEHFSVRHRGGQSSRDFPCGLPLKQTSACLVITADTLQLLLQQEVIPYCDRAWEAASSGLTPWRPQRL